LENGKTTGQAARLLYEPARREKLQAEAAKAKQAEEQSKASKKAGGKAAADGKATKMDIRAKVPEPVQSPAIDEEEEEEEEEEETDEVAAASRYSFSLVCYGLPNLVVVAQPSKS